MKFLVMLKQNELLRESTGTPRIKAPTFALLVVTNYLDQMRNSKVAAGGLVFTNK